MIYLYSIVSITILVVLQMIGANLLSATQEAPRHGAWSANYRAVAENAIVLLPTSELDETSDLPDSGKPYGLHYNVDENSWSLYAAVLQLKTTSVYGRPGEIAQIEYSLDGQRLRNGWIVLRVDDYSFVDETSKATSVETGQKLQLYISGTYVSAAGLDWDKCPKDDTYCLYAGFVEGGFPKSEDYGGLTLCPSNTIIRAGFLPDDWINGMLVWKIRIISNS
jgi:hypothetical protein